MSNWIYPLLAPNNLDWDFPSWLSLFDTDNELKGTIEKASESFVGSSHRFEAKDGKIKLEAVVPGHKVENIKVLINDFTHTMRIEDVVDKAENETRSGKERPWWYSDLKLEFKVPETIDKKSFTKRVENGVLTVTATYDEVKQDSEIEVC